MSVLQQINKAQIRPHVVDANHIDITTVGKSLITKIEVGTGLSISNSTGADSGTGVVTLALDGDLGAISALDTLGIVIRDTTNHFTTRSLAVSSNLTLSNADGILGDPTLDLADTGVTAGNYKYLTVDAKGRITAGTSILSSWVANEICPNPSSDNVHYTLANNPVNGTLMVFVDGTKQLPGADKDYTYNELTNVITFTSANLSTDVISACYFYSSDNNNLYEIQVEALTPFDGGLMRYRLTYIPNSATVVVFLNGVKQMPGATNDYTLDGQDIVFNNATVVSDAVSVMYFRA
jgi:hypothetical protein